MSTLTIRELGVMPYALPLRGVATVGGHEIHEREGIVVRLLDEDGDEGYGEAVPLLGLHQESRDEVQMRLKDVAERIAGQTLDAPEQLFDGLSDLPPTLVFALESAWDGLRATKEKTVPARLNGRDAPTSLHVNGFFSGSVDDAKAVLEHEIYRKYPSVKIKVARQPLEQDREMLKLFAGTLPKSVRLRLDANRGLDLASALALFGELDPERVEYLEEPLENVNDLAALQDRTGHSIALDESLGGPNMRGIDCVDAWIYKPSVHGGRRALEAKAKEADAAGVSFVVSSCLETGLGLWMQAQWAAAAAAGMDEAVPVGLGTDIVLATDLLDVPFDSSQGHVGIDNWCGKPGEMFLQAAGWAKAGV